jgi:hypothetical protein
MIFGAPGDSTGSIADLWFQQEFGLQIFGDRLVTIQGGPFGYVQNSWPLLTSSALSIPAWLIGHVLDEVFVYNILVLSGIILTGFTTYLLLRFLEVTFWLSITGGAFFTLMPYHVMTATSWYSQTHLEALPLTLLYGLMFFGGPSRRGAIRFLLAILLGGLTNAYVGLFCLVGAVGLAIPFAIKWYFSFNLPNKLKVALSASLTAVLLLIVSTAIRRLLGLDLGRTAGELHVYGLRIEEFLRPNPFNSSWHRRSFATDFSNLHGSNPVEITLYVGATLLTLATAYIVLFIIRRNSRRLPREVVLSLSTTALVSLWIAMSQGIAIGSLRLPNGAQWIFDQLPYWRVFSRVSLVAALVVVIFATLMINQMFDRLRGIFRGRNSLISVGLVGLLIATALFDIRTEPPVRTTQVGPPKIVEEIRETVPGLFTAYPLKPWHDPWTYDLRFWQRIHRRPMVNGGTNGAPTVDLQASLLNPARDETLDGLLALGSSHILVDRFEYKRLWGTPLPVNKRLKKIISRGRYSILMIEPNPNTIASWISGSNHGPELATDGRTWRWLSSQRFTLNAYASVPGCHEIAIDIQTVGGQPIHLKTMKYPSSSVSLNPKSFHIWLSDGLNEIPLSVQISTSALPDGRPVTVYVSNPLVRTALSRSCSLE